MSEQWATAWPTEAEARDALEEYAERWPDEERGHMWVFERSSDNPHSYEQAIRIVQTCLYLGMRPTDRVSAETWFVVMKRLATLERRVAAVEDAPGGDK